MKIEPKHFFQSQRRFHSPSPPAQIGKRTYGRPACACRTGPCTQTASHKRGTRVRSCAHLNPPPKVRKKKGRQPRNTQPTALLKRAAGGGRRKKDVRKHRRCLFKLERVEKLPPHSEHISASAASTPRPSACQYGRSALASTPRNLGAGARSGRHGDGDGDGGSGARTIA